MKQAMARIFFVGRLARQRFYEDRLPRETGWLATGDTQRRKLLVSVRRREPR
jgi:hypothetical protein